MTVLKNSIWITTSAITSKIVAFFTTILIARELGVELYGLYSLIFTIVGLATLVGNYGFDPLMIREIARAPSNANVSISNTIVLKLIFSFISITLMIVLGGLLRHDAALPLTILGVSLLIYNPLATISVSFFGREELQWSGLLNVFCDVTRLIALIVCLRVSSGLLSVITAYAIANLVTSVFLALIGKYKVKFQCKIERRKFKRTMAEALPFAINGLIFMIYFKIDIVILSWFKGDVAVGTYSAAYRVIEALLFIPAGIMGATYPAFARKSGTSDTAFWRSFEKITKYLAIMGIPIGFAVAVLAPKIVVFLYGTGQQWNISATYLRVLIWTISLIFINASFPNALNARGKQKISAFVLLCGAGINILLNLVLIPLWDALGACIATVSTEIITTLFFFYIFRKDHVVKTLCQNLLKPVGASLAMVAGIILVYRLTLVTGIFTGLFTYIAAILALKALDSEDKELLLPFLRKRQNGL